MRTISVTIFVVLLASVYSEPQLITTKDGKLGVNFGGYHAAVGLGGILGGGAGGGLFAEAGTPTGQAARAGLGGGVSSDGRTAGGLYAGATAGGNVKAEAGLAGGVDTDKTAGIGYATSQAGGHDASAGLVGLRKQLAKKRKEERRKLKEIEKEIKIKQHQLLLGGETSVAGSTGFTYSKTKSFGAPVTVIKETEVVPVDTIKYKNVNKELNIDAVNEVNPAVSLTNAGFDANAGVNIHTEVRPPVIVKEVSKWRPREVYYVPQFPNVNLQEIMGSLFRVPSQGARKQFWWMSPKKSVRVSEVYVEPQTKVVEKHIVRSKPHRHHVHKTAFIGGYIGGDGGIAATPETVVYKSVQPVVEKRVDIGTQGSVNAGTAVAAGGHGSGGGQVTYTKEVTVGRNPDFFQQIFNIPIATLQAVSNLLTNTAKNVSIQKTATVVAGAHY